MGDPATPPIIQSEEIEPEPESLIRESLIELQTSLPASLNIPKEVFEQFLSNISLAREPIAFELLGTAHKIATQFAIHPSDAGLLRRQLEAYFPEVVFHTTEGHLVQAWESSAADETLVIEFGLEREFMFLLASGKLDPFIGIIGALSELQENEVALFQVLFQPVRERWAQSITRIVSHADGKPLFINKPELTEAAGNKVSKLLYAAVVRLAVRSESESRTLQIARDVAASLRAFENINGNTLVPLSNEEYPFEEHVEDTLLRQSRRSGMVLNSDELIGFVHLPSSAVRSTKLQRESGKTNAAPAIVRQREGVLLGNNVHAGQTVQVRLTPEQRTRHVHIIGASGTGKSTLLFNLLTEDIANGRGVAVLDPHGDLVDRLLGTIPENRISDVVLVDPSDEEYAIGFNILDAHSELEKQLLAYLAKLEGTNWVGVGEGVNYRVRALLASGQSLFVGGDFTTAGGLTNAMHIAKWDGQVWSTIGNGVDGLAVPDYDFEDQKYPTVKRIVKRGSDLFVSGSFSVADPGGDSVPVSSIAQATWNESEQRWRWSEMDRGIYNTIDLPDSPWVESLAIREGAQPGAYDVIAAGLFYGAGSGSLVSWGVARWCVGQPFPTNCPQVTISSPVQYELFEDPTSITNSATATPFNSPIETVEFFVDNTSIGVVNSAPYKMIWDSPTVGLHRLYAVATDQDGVQGQSKPVTFQVESSTNSIMPQPDFYTLLMDEGETNLNVLTNDSPSDGSLRIKEVSRLRPSGPRGESMGSLGSIKSGHDGTYFTYVPYPHAYGTDLFSYAVTNSGGGHAFCSVEIRILAKPRLIITSPTAFERFGLTSPPVVLTIAGQAFDYDGTVTNISLFLDGAAWNQTNANLFSFNWTNSSPGFFTFTAVARDNDGLSNKVWVLVNVYEVGATNIVTASIDNLNGTPHELIESIPPIIREGFYDLEGKARDSNTNNLVSYQLQLLRPEDNMDGGDSLIFANVTPGPLDAAGFHQGGDTNGGLGTLDFAGIPNGTYDLKLIVHSGGSEATATARFRLESELKIGQFSFSEQDLAVPVSGIPLTVVRTYNSMNPEAGDFGYGWSFALNSMDVKLDETRKDFTVGSSSAPWADEDEDENGLPLSLNVRTGGSRNVTLTLPDGRRTTFAFDPLVSPYDCRARARWKAAPGVLYGLSPLKISGSSDEITLIPFQQPRWQDGGENSNFENYDIPGWVLTNYDGTKYVITRGQRHQVMFLNQQFQQVSVTAYDAQPKLTEIHNRSGDWIEIRNNYIRHYFKSNGVDIPTRSILIERDEANRIVAIRDPNTGTNGSPTMKYVYNRDTGNLIQVHRLTDRVASTYTVVKYHYDNPNFPHYITSIEDPRGIPLARNEYDDSGKLIAVVDADGKRTSITHNTNGRVEIVTDRLGNTNSYAYDPRGNVTNIVNALGIVSVMTYDDNNYKTAETNAVGTASVNWTLYGYDSNGNQTMVVNSLGKTNLTTYDNSGNLLTQTDPQGNVTTNTFDAAGNLLISQQLDSQGNPISRSSSVYQNNHLVETRNASDQITGSFGYDSSGNQTGSTNANNFAQNFAYDANGNQTMTWYASAPVTNRTEYDPQGRVTRTIDPLGNTNQTFYNTLGKVEYTVDKFGNTNSFLYDPRGKLIQTKHADGLVTHTVYDENGRAFLTTDRNGITGTYTYYDAAGRATNSVRVTNVVVSIDAGPHSVITTAGTPISSSTTLYYESGWVKARIGPDGKTNTFVYYADGQLQCTIDPLGHTNSFKYDDSGRRQFATNANNQVTQFAYDAVGRLIKTIYADNTFTTNIFNLLGQRTGVKDQAGLLTQFAYDVSGQLTNVTKPAVPDPEDNYSSANPPSWSYQYDQQGHLTVITDPKNRSTTNIYDDFGRQIARRLPLTSNIESNHFNAKGQLALHYDFKGQRTEFRYDQFGRLTNKFYFISGETHPSNSVRYIYNNLGQLTNITERSGSDAASGYAGLGGGKGKWMADGKRHYARAVVGYLSQVPKGVWGGLAALLLCGFVLSCVPGARRREFVFCFIDTWRNNHTAELVNHRRLRLPSLFWRSATVATLVVFIANDPSFDRIWTANAACDTPVGDNLSSSTERITSFKYDIEGRLEQVHSPEGHINYGYDLATGRHTSTCTTNSSLAYDYDELGRLLHVTVLKRNRTNCNNEVTTYGYNAVGSRTSIVFTNGVNTHYEYDNLNRLVGLTNRAADNSVLSSFTYQLHSTGRRTNAIEVLRTEYGTNQVTTLSWAYDGMYRLTNEVCITTGGNSYTNSYEYDKVGNRWKKINIFGGVTRTTTNVYNANDQLLKEITFSNSVPVVTNLYAYDDNGSLIAKTNVSSSARISLYAYDLKNKLSSVAAYDGAWTTNRFEYNDQGIRVRTIGPGSSAYYLVDANNHTGYAQILEELSNPVGLPSKSYVIGDDVLAQSGDHASYLLYDGHGNTRQLTNPDGTIANRYNYEAYGVTLGTSSASPLTSLLYCGEQYDSALNMYNLRARFYDPSNGRFNAIDSFAGNNFDPQSLHKYTYAHHDPITGIDPSGHGVITDIMLAISAVFYMAAFYLAPVITIVSIIAAVTIGAMIIADQHFAQEFFATWMSTGGNPVAEMQLIIGEVRTLRTAIQVTKTLEVQGGTKALSAAEETIVSEASQILGSPEFTKILEAQKAGQPTTVVINGRKIGLQPDFPCSAMTWKEANGFTLGKEAFTSEEELVKTLLHELHRLNTSAALDAGLITAEAATKETQAAYNFAEKAAKKVIKKE